MANQNLPTAGRRSGMMSPFDLLQDRIDRMFEDFGGMPMRRDMLSNRGFELMPSLEMHDEGNKVTLNAELPGVAEPDIEISTDDNLLTISGEKKSEFEDKQNNGNYRSERTYGRFSRSVELPFRIDPAKVDARFTNGVLKLTIEKPADAGQQSRKIPIRH
jgi:HSP20 family protein